MAEHQSSLDDWRPVPSPDGRTFYFNSRTNETSWVPPKSPHAPATAPASQQINDSTPMQNASPPPPYHLNGHAASPPLPNSGSYPSHPHSPPANPYPHSPNNIHYSPAPPPQGYGQPSFPHSGSFYPQPHPPRPESSRSSTSFRSVLGSAVKAVLSPGNLYGPQYGNSGYTQGVARNSVGPPSTTAFNNSGVIVNMQSVDQQTLLRLQMKGVNIPPGRYWYDARCGAWGMESGPCVGVIAAGENLGGSLRADASGPSMTGVFINGRQIHALDVIRLQAMGVLVMPGRWWVDAGGRYGLEGTFITLGTLAPHGMASAGSSSSSWSDGRGNFGGQGDNFGYVGGTDSTGRVWSVDYGS